MSPPPASLRKAEPHLKGQKLAAAEPTNHHNFRIPKPFPARPDSAFQAHPEKARSPPEPILTNFRKSSTQPDMPGRHPDVAGSSPSIGLNLRVTGYCNQGGRKYMEDVFSVAYQQTEDEKDLEYAFFGIFDGHGGREAAVFAKEHLMDFIVRQKSFWSDDDEGVLKAIHEGYMQTHQAMWKELENWPKTASGLPSTAGTTASIAFIRRGKIYVGHVGDSAIVLGVQDPDNKDNWTCEPLTIDHKPESLEESRRIHECGGKVVCKSGVPRVVWNRPRMGHKGPVRRSTHIDEIPFLAVARSLGDLWSYNSEENVFVVSPEPDTFVYPIDINKHRCLVLGTDGAWNMLTPEQAVKIVCEAEKSNEQHMLNPSSSTRQWINPSKRLVDKAIEKWTFNNLRADNTSIVTVMLDPPGPPRAQVLKRQRELAQELSSSSDPPMVPSCRDFTASDRGSVALVTNTTPQEEDQHREKISSKSDNKAEEDQKKKDNHISIISRFPNSRNVSEAHGHNLVEKNNAKLLHDFQPQPSSSNLSEKLPRLSTSLVDKSNADSTSQNPREEVSESNFDLDSDIQCNEVSSSEDEDLVKEKKKKFAGKDKKKVLRASSRLSKELSALQLESAKKEHKKTNKRRSRNCSDTENVEQDSNRPRRLRSSSSKSHLDDVERQCEQLSAKIRHIEKNMSRKTAHLNQQVKLFQSTFSKSKKTEDQQRKSTRSNLTEESSVRTLRPRTPKPSTSEGKSSPRKRKISSSCPESSTKTPKLHEGSRSSRTLRLAAEKPIVRTRSKTARVLKLKK